MTAVTTTITVVRDLSTMPASGGGSSRGFGAGTTLQLGPPLGWSDLGERRRLLAPADDTDPLVVTLLPPSSASDARQALVVRLHTEIARRVAASGGWAAGSDLRGVPRWIGLVQADDGAGRVAVSEVDLTGHGFYSVAEVVTSYWNDFCELPMARRTEFVRSLLRTAAAFDDLSYVHGALDPTTVLLGPRDGTVVVTGVGSGALLSTGRRQVCSVGAAGEFHAPELLDAAGPRPELVGPATDRWSFGVALFYLLFGVHPLYFLPNLGRGTVERYLKTNSWPAAPTAATVSGWVDPEFALRLEAEWSQLPDEVAGTFRQLVEGGWAMPSSRPSVVDWVAAFKVALAPPSFLRLGVGSSLVIEGGEVTVTWETADADEVEIVGFGRFPPTGTTRLALSHSCRLEVRAYGALGTATDTTRHIDVVTVSGGSGGGAVPTAGAASSLPDADPADYYGSDDYGSDDYSDDYFDPSDDEDVDGSYDGAGTLGLAGADRGLFLSDLMFGTPPGLTRLFDPEPHGLEPPRPGDQEPPTSAYYAMPHRREPAVALDRKSRRHLPKATP